MSIVEQVKNLQDPIIENEERLASFRSLKEALEDYHKMVDSGELTPRGNKVDAGYHIYSINSNLSAEML